MQLPAQDNIPGNQDIYGLNPLLYNGRLYSYFVVPGTIGNQFMENDEFVPGSVTLRDVTFSNLDLNYDVYNQQLVLKYHNPSRGISLITISDAWLQSFTLGDLNFRIIQTADTTRKIFRVIGSGPMFLLEYRTKNLALDDQPGKRNYRFSALKTEHYLMSENQIKPYTGNRSFLALLPPDKKNLVKDFMHIHRIRLRKAGDKALSELINFCNKP